VSAGPTPTVAGTLPRPPPGDLEPALRARVLQARDAWPGASLADEDFVRHVTAKLGDDPAADLDRLRLPELFLACACAQKDPAAIAHFERAYFAEVDAAVRRFDSLPMTLEDVRQRVREKLYLHDPPALAGYAGQGDLGGWLRALVLHMLINVATRETRERPHGVPFFDAIVDTSADAEAAYLKEACRAEFEQAFIAALARLAPRDKVLLRYAFADGQSVDQIGAIFRVHRATAARWIAKARDQLVDETRAELMRALRIGEGDAASIVRAALSRMGTTLLRRLG
jgi:RNA polymerase sigma-70 factor (ECF subfamily)